MIFPNSNCIQYHRQKGVVLIVVLMFVFSLSILGFFTFERAILQYKMTQNFQNKVYNSYNAEAKVSEIVAQNDFWGLGRCGGFLVGDNQELGQSGEYLAKNVESMADMSLAALSATELSSLDSPSSSPSSLSSPLVLLSHYSNSHFFETQTLYVHLAQSESDEDLEELPLIKLISRSTIKEVEEVEEQEEKEENQEQEPPSIPEEFIFDPELYFRFICFARLTKQDPDRCQ